MRHKLSGNWILELPFGPNRAFLNKGGVWAKIMDGYSISGNYTFATGDVSDAELRRDAGRDCGGLAELAAAEPGAWQSIKGQGTLKHWFNTAAFVATAGRDVGDASRNSVQLPGTVSVNGSLSRTVPLGDTRSFEVRVNANNVFNTVQYRSIDTQINSQTFGSLHRRRRCVRCRLWHGFGFREDLAGILV